MSRFCPLPLQKFTQAPVPICLRCSSVQRLQRADLTSSLVKEVKKVKCVDLYSASSRSASNAPPLPVSRRWSPQANPTAMHLANTARPRIRVDVSRDMFVYSSSLRRVLISSVEEYLKYYFKYMSSILYLYFKYFSPELLVLKILLHWVLSILIVSNVKYVFKIL